MKGLWEILPFDFPQIADEEFSRFFRGEPYRIHRSYTIPYKIDGGSTGFEHSPVREARMGPYELVKLVFESGYSRFIGMVECRVPLSRGRKKAARVTPSAIASTII